MKKILLFIPMYNCEQQIVRTLEQLDENVIKYISEVIVVDNQSQDKSISVARQYVESEYKYSSRTPIHILRNDNNYGLGGSHKVAFQYAIDYCFDYIIVLHGDNQGDVHDIIPYLNRNKVMQLDSLLGSRFEKQSRLINYSKFRILGNHCFNILLSILLRKHISDLGSGLNMYCTEYIRSRFYLNFPNNLTFNVYMLIYGVYCNSSFYFFPLTWKEEDQISNAKVFSQSMEILELVCKYILCHKKVFNTVPNEYSKIDYTYEKII